MIKVVINLLYIYYYPSVYSVRMTLYQLDIIYIEELTKLFYVSLSK
nr:MAG TPA: hypothetical protein [Caudoviricetes sp.]